MPESKNKIPEEHLVFRGWYPCDGEERWCEDCAKTGKQYSAVYKIIGSNHKLEPGVSYFGLCVRCKDCNLYVYADPDGKEIRRVYVKPKEKK